MTLWGSRGGDLTPSSEPSAPAPTSSPGAPSQRTRRTAPTSTPSSRKTKGALVLAEEKSFCSVQTHSRSRNRQSAGGVQGCKGPGVQGGLSRVARALRQSCCPSRPVGTSLNLLCPNPDWGPPSTRRVPPRLTHPFFRYPQFPWSVA